METAITVLIWVVIGAVALWVLSAIFATIIGVFVMKKAQKGFREFDREFTRATGRQPLQVRGRKLYRGNEPVDPFDRFFQ